MLLMACHGAIALLCLLLGIHFLLMPSRRRAPLQLLGFTYLLYASQSVFLLLQLASVDGWALSLRPVGAMLLGPASWMFWQLLLRQHGNWRWQDMIHAVPALVTCWALMTHSALLALLDLLLLASFAGYLLAIIFQLSKGLSALKVLKQDAVGAWRYLQLQATLLAANLLIEVLIWLDVSHGVQLTEASLANSAVLLSGAMLFLLVHMVGVLLALQRSRLLEWLYQLQYVHAAVKNEAASEQKDALAQDKNVAKMQPETETAACRGLSIRQQSSGQDAQDVDVKLAALLQRWLALLQQEQLFTFEYGITLAQAARKLQVPARQLSNAINLHYGASFSVLLNDQRIAHAKELLVSMPDLPVTEIIAKAGFASKSNFHKEFLRVTGTTPTLYREQGLAKKCG